MEVSNSKTHAFKTFDQSEGIELVAGKIQTFQIVEMKDKTKEKAISEKPISKEIIAVIGAFEKDVRSITDESKKIDEPIIEKATKESSKAISRIEGVSSVNIIPEILEEKRIITPQDIEAWKKLSTFERILLFQKTPKSIISKRRGFLLPEFAGKDKKTLTDENFQMFSYIPANTMKQSANIAFLFEWSAVVESEKYFDDEICLRGYFQVEINGKLFRRPCGGSCKKKGMMDWGDTMEGAISEMEKRGIYNFLHGDVKRGEFDES
jgi:hypothetical protein